MQSYLFYGLTKVDEVIDDHFFDRQSELSLTINIVIDDDGRERKGENHICVEDDVAH